MAARTSSKEYTVESKLSGHNASFIKAKLYDSGQTLHVECYLKPVDGKPGEISGLEWDGARAKWDIDEEEKDIIKHYEVRLYRNKKPAATVTATGGSYDFRNHITQEGDYTFRVRAIAKYESRAGDWSDHSEENTFTEHEAGYGSGSWVQDQHGWWYRYNNGDYPASSWQISAGIKE